jgi:hypothetical protein
MYNNNQNYRTQESMSSMFLNSCLGKIVILLVILGIVALAAHLTRPSEETMRTEILDDIRQCIESPDSVSTDWLDDAVANVGYAFTNADSVVNYELLATFNRYNRLVYYKHPLYSSMHVFNNFHSEGIRCGIGIFGLVIPTINFNDLLLRVGPIRKDYNNKILEDTGDTEYFGSTPDLIFKEGDYDNFD